MSIICENDLGWVVDHESFINDIYNNCREIPVGLHVHGESSRQRPAETPDSDRCSTQEGATSLREISKLPPDDSTVEYLACYRFRHETFNINEPFQMESSFLKQQQREKEEIHTEKLVNEVTVTKKRKKKRKRILPQNTGEIQRTEFHERVKPQLEAALSELIHLAQRKGYFTCKGSTARDNNKEARETAAFLQGIGSSLKEWCQMSRNFQIEEAQEVVLDETGDVPSLVNVLVHHRGSTPAVQRLMGQSYLLPPNTSFLISDIAQMEPFFLGQTFDLIVMDPPWSNASVRRKREYLQLDNEDLLKIPVVASPGALLVVWTTNRMAHHEFIRDTLLPHWRAEFVGHWFWLKTTTSGQPVYGLDSEHSKRPYESLLVARVTAEDSTIQLPCPPAHKVIVSVPCSLHSSKPPLTEILKPYVRPGGRCLELFARNLLPNWTSWGNETILFQHVNFFQKISRTFDSG